MSLGPSLGDRHLVCARINSEGADARVELLFGQSTELRSLVMSRLLRDKLVKMTKISGQSPTMLATCRTNNRSTDKCSVMDRFVFLGNENSKQKDGSNGFESTVIKNCKIDTHC